MVSGPTNSRCSGTIAVGLVHFLAHGRIDEVCGERVRELYSKGYYVKGLPLPATQGDKPTATGAFFGVSFALQDVVLLLTEVNERRSISGSVPMLVPRN